VVSVALIGFMSTTSATALVDPKRSVFPTSPVPKLLVTYSLHIVDVYREFGHPEMILSIESVRSASETPGEVVVRQPPVWKTASAWPPSATRDLPGVGDRGEPWG
jgi:hypothetical protein